MLLLPPPCKRPDDGSDGDSGEWTSGKKPRRLSPSRRSDTGEVADARLSSSSSDALEEQVPDLGDPYDLEELRKHVDPLSERPQLLVSRGELDLEALRQLYKRLVHYRMIAHESLPKGECKCKVTLRDGLPDFLERAVSRDDLHILLGLFFRQLNEEEGGTIEWSFESTYKFDYQSDYNRLVLKNYLPKEGTVYWNWELYCSLFTTYEMDKDYVKFVDEMSSKLQWLKLYFGFAETSDKWDEMRCRGVIQALKIAKKYTNMNATLANLAFEEYVWRLRYDYLHCEGKDGLFFEIRKRLTDGQLTFEAALRELHVGNFKTRHENLILRVLENGWRRLEQEYNSCVKGIPGDASEDEAKNFIRAAVLKLHELKKPLHKYMEKKMLIAKNIGLVN